MHVIYFLFSVRFVDGIRAFSPLKEPSWNKGMLLRQILHVYAKGRISPKMVRTQYIKGNALNFRLDRREEAQEAVI